MSNVSLPQHSTSTAQHHTNAIAHATTVTIDYYMSGDTLIMPSATTPGRLYITTAIECSCPAGRDAWPCKHADVRLSLLAPQRTRQVSGTDRLTVDELA